MVKVSDIGSRWIQGVNDVEDVAVFVQPVTRIEKALGSPESLDEEDLHLIVTAEEDKGVEGEQRRLGLTSFERGKHCTITIVLYASLSHTTLSRTSYICRCYCPNTLVAVCYR